VGAAPPTGNDPGQIRELLATAQGYAVFGREGRRVGAFIELAGPDGERIAIRHDGVLLWHRRLLPITTVATVSPEERAVVLNVHRHSLPTTMAAPDAVGTPLPAEEGAHISGELQQRIARYVSAGERKGDQASADSADAASKPSAETAGLEHPVTGAAGQPTPEPAQSDQRSAAGHVLFVSTSRGYALVELERPPPALGQSIEVPEQPGSFLVAKLGPSPFPNDPRTCAYLERIE
jgi:hypothetical protein